MYKFIAKGLFESSMKEHMFVHLFLILDWNLMKRSANCVNMKVAHIRFHKDALVFEFAKSKVMQGGEDHVGPWHVYVNPLNPFICPLLALAQYFLTFPETAAFVFIVSRNVRKYRASARRGQINGFNRFAYTCQGTT